jgi:high-affinity iron transporter
MWGIALIVFREVLEAALIISIVMIASRGAHHRGRWVFGGVLLGLLGSLLLALMADRLAQALEGVGQELFSAAVLMIAVGMLTWHSVSMQQHGREMARDMKQLGREVLEGQRSLHGLALVVGLAVLREGSELIIFLYGLVSAEEGGLMDLLGGGGLGLLLGALVGLVLYFGLAKIPLKYFFSVTSLLILFLTAGLAAQAAAFLVEADWLPPLGQGIWDTSGWLPEKSLPGQILHALVGYVDHPDGIEVVFYLGTLLLSHLLMRMVAQSSPPAPGHKAP